MKHRVITVIVLLLIILSTIKLGFHPVFYILAISTVALIYQKTKRLLPKPTRRYVS
jgi:hypothetical protein